MPRHFEHSLESRGRTTGPSQHYDNGAMTFQKWIVMGHEHGTWTCAHFCICCQLFWKSDLWRVKSVGLGALHAFFWSGLSWILASQMCQRDQHFPDPYRQELWVTSESEGFITSPQMADCLLPSLDIHQICKTIWTCLNWVGLFSKICQKKPACDIWKGHAPRIAMIWAFFWVTLKLIYYL